MSFGGSGPTGSPTGSSTSKAMGQGMENVSTALAVAGKLIDGYNEAARLKRQATMALGNATASNQAAALNADAARREGRMALGAQTAGAAQNGLGFSGSVLQSIAQSAGNVEYDAANVLHAGQVKATDFQNEALAARSAAKNAVTQAWIGAGSTLLSAGAKAFTMGT